MIIRVPTHGSLTPDAKETKFILITELDAAAQIADIENSARAVARLLYSHTSSTFFRELVSEFNHMDKRTQEGKRIYKTDTQLLLEPYLVNADTKYEATNKGDDTDE
jgi:hypothetical protein